MTLLLAIELFITGGVIGFIMGMTGVGGGALMVPALTVVFALLPSVAVGTASIFTFLTKIVGTYKHYRLVTIDWHASGIFLCGAIPGGIGSAMSVTYMVDHSPGFQAQLRLIVAITMLSAVGLMLFQMFHNWTSEEEETDDASKGVSLLPGIGFGFVVGAVVGATALGAAILAIPILLVVYRLPTRKAVGSCIFISLAITLFTSMVYAKGGQVAWSTVGMLSLGSVIGVSLGSGMVVKISERPLRLVVLGLIVSASILMLMS